LKALLEALPVGVHFSQDATCQRISGNAATLAQYDATPEDNISVSATDERAAGRNTKYIGNGRLLKEFELPLQRAVAENRIIAPVELEIELPNGRRWIAEASGAPIHDTHGNVVGGVAVTLDITERKRVEEALRRSERLELEQKEVARLNASRIEAQEKERSRIARELHDDICQRLAMLCIQLDRIATTDIERLGDIAKASKLGKEIAQSVRALSRELHSPQVDHLGVVASVGAFCRDVAEQHGVEINFTNTDVPVFLPGDVSTCIVRVVQETLRNAITHSGVKTFNVCVRGADGVIVLQVSDKGRGFDSNVAGVKGGLGFVSLRERLHLVKGTLTVESKPNQGTTITARIPYIGSVAVSAVPVVSADPNATRVNPAAKKPTNHA
jgi:signal transduction histidine kinase